MATNPQRILHPQPHILKTFKNRYSKHHTFWGRKCEPMLVRTEYICAWVFAINGNQIFSIYFMNNSLTTFASIEIVEFG